MLSSWTVLATATVWTALYHGIRYQFKLDPEWSCRLLTAFHATLVTVLAVLACFLGPWPFTDPGGPNTTLQCIVLVTSLGYFIFDFIWCLYHQTEGATMLIHHAVSIIAISRVLMKGVSGTEAVAGVGGLEITNPLLQARWFLRSSGYKGLRFYTHTTDLDK
ncbi:TLC domain-containing protein 5-like isoform X3 [Schistocerca gregaria]|uniref:TLC domain-containing protein 5-like isoform X3 n=1 Tax=Schistocerca gregaria TaxID=7010 RepID=UPI00211E950F|nr:TLC domain-containing protein 5-like isoform X3 [Schistocerca gregaria]